MDRSGPSRPSTDDIAALRAGLRGGLLEPGDEGYDDARVVWNGMIDRRPALIARCAGAADVIDCVGFARDHGLPLAVRGGGHNVAGYAVCEGGLVVDLSAMRAVRVDAAARLAWVQGGALWGDVDRETTAFGLATPGGLISQTGVGGLTLSGGIGWLRGAHGLCVDNLMAVDIVTADGRLLHASEDEHADLFWAVRGGGGNFGVVTGFTFRLHPIPPALMFCGPAYPEARARELLPLWRDFVAHGAGAAGQPRRVLDHSRTTRPTPRRRAGSGCSRSRPSTTVRPRRARRWWRRCARSARRSWISAVSCRTARSRASTTRSSRRAATAATGNRSTCARSTATRSRTSSRIWPSARPR